MTICTVFILGPLLTSASISDYFLNSQTVKYLFNASGLKITFRLPQVFENPWPRDTVNGSLWSLPYELLCYILVAFSGALFKANYRTVIILAISACLFLAFMEMPTFFTYTVYFLAGGLIYIYRNWIAVNFWIFCIAIIGLFATLRYNLPLAIDVFVIGLSLSYIVMYLAIVQFKPFHNFSKYGDFSYGLYVWAFLVQQVLGSTFGILGVYSNFLLSFIITMVMAVLSWHLIEKHALRLKKYHPRDWLNVLKRKMNRYPAVLSLPLKE